MTNDTGRQVLAVTLEDDDSGATTISGYLVALAAAVWREGEGFSGKRPFGNSGWAWDVYAALVRAGLIEGTFDDYGGLEDADTEKGDALISEAIKALANLTREEDEVRDELRRQDAKFGPQNHPDGTGPDKNWSYLGPASYLAESARATCTALVAVDRVSWSDVLLEEVAEAFAEDDPDKLLAELLQVEAVARQWRMAIRRRLASQRSEGQSRG